MKKKWWIAALSAAAVGTLACGLVGCAQKDDDVVYGEWVTTVAATCEEKGVQIRVSLTDPNKIQERSIPAIGHDWNEWQTLTPATCLAEGSRTRTCKTCENSDFQSVKALGHEWGEWETVVAPTCRVAGYETRVCLRDEKHTENRSIEALGHDWSDWIVTTAPTCEELGEKTRYCRNDNAHTEKTDISRLYHSWNDWVVTKAPTESEEGEETRTCRYDNEHTQTRAMLPLGSEGLAFTLNDDGTGYRVSLQSNYRTARAVYIPESYNGLPVTEVADYAFMSCVNLEEVVFCGKSSVRKIGSDAFGSCVKLRQIDLPNSLIEIGNRVFYNCSSLESLVIPEGVTTLPEYFLIRCASLRSVSFPSSWIPSKTFLDRVYTCFSGCTSLEEITVGKKNQYVRAQSGCLIERATNKLLYGTKAAVIPEGVTSIGRLAFIRSEIESVEIPASVTEIGLRAFEQCKNLKRVTFAPNSNLTEINITTFGYCDALEYLEIPASVTELTCNGGFNRVSVQAVVIAEENETFVKDGGCIIEKQTGVLRYGGKDAVIPEYVTAIGDETFYNVGLTAETIIIPAGVKSIGKEAFYGNSNVKSITFNRSADGKLLSSLESVEYQFIGYTGIKEFVIPASVKTVGKGAFDYTSLQTLTVEEGNACFKTESGCLIETATNTLYCVLNGAEIPESVTAIARHAFSVWGDSYIVIPESVTSVDRYAFDGTYSHQTIVLAGFASQEEADAAWGTDWRQDCYVLIVYGKN